jgi:hypothetical protein
MHGAFRTPKKVKQRIMGAALEVNSQGIMSKIIKQKL